MEEEVKYGEDEEERVSEKRENEMSVGLGDTKREKEKMVREGE